MAKREEMTLLQFQEQFSTEEACLEHLRNMKWPEGFVCPRCKHDQCFDLPKRKLFQCKACKYQASATAGTVMHKTRTPLLKWFWAIFLMSHDKRGVSGETLQRELELTRYCAWTIEHKIRHAMGEIDGNYLLSGLVELDEGFFGAPTEGGKRGRGTDKTPVMTGLSLDLQGRPQYVHMQVLNAVNGAAVLDFAEKYIQPYSMVNTDGLNIYNVLDGPDYDLWAEKFDPVSNPDHLDWIHTFISNAKAFIGGTYHGLDKKYMQLYLNEFCWRANRRKFKGQWFNRLLHTCSLNSPVTYKQLVRS
jgi:transposase-like protein